MRGLSSSFDALHGAIVWRMVAKSSRVSPPHLLPNRPPVLNGRLGGPIQANIPLHLSPACRRNLSSASSNAPSDDRWLHLVESSAKSPNLHSVPQDYRDRLCRVFTISFQIDAYIIQPDGKPFDPQGEVARYQRQKDFALAQVPLKSEISRGRHAVAILILAMVKDVKSIPKDAEVRVEYPSIFSFASEMEQYTTRYLKTVKGGRLPTTGEIVDRGARWAEFWLPIQKPTKELGDLIGFAGYSNFEEIWDGSNQAMKEIIKWDIFG